MDNTRGVIVDFMSIASAIKNDFIQFVPDLIAGFIILFCGVFFAYLVKWLSQGIVQWLCYILPVNLTKKSIMRDTLNSVSVGTGRVFFILIIFLTITSSMDKMGFKVLSIWLQNLAKYTPNIVGAIFILFLGWSFKKNLSEFILKALDRIGTAHSMLVSEVISWGVFAISLLVSMDQIGIDLGFLFIFFAIIIAIPFGAISLAFALGVKGAIEDILACYHVRKILRVEDQIYFDDKKRKVASIGPVFITLESTGESLSVPGNIFIRNYHIHKKD